MMGHHLEKIPDSTFQSDENELKNEYLIYQYSNSIPNHIVTIKSHLKKN